MEIKQITIEDKTCKNQISHVTETIFYESKGNGWNMPTKEMAITFLSYLYPEWDASSRLMPYK